ncbi:helix-turn-helix transcriptional regulator [Actinomadura luteofluorescens]|uniref:DNA-binding CsgD family transcriptional regulator n=1 Tax=Actinomadura luteofluorescens TaxID=46163 RepID=A0A7Y9EQI4_9ACTN|nr:AAA family ATPase [Actinomadura luteofluorescens]NYD51971.1 DNA-binding CsgD family transcriptional regulator [Actinomadura luteofluorescens]
MKVSKTDQECLPPFVGRREAVGVLEEAYAEARRGVPRAVFVTGEPGIGKSALLRRFQQTAPNATFLVGGCLDLGDAPSYAPFVGLLRSLVRQVGLDTLRSGLTTAVVNALAWLLPDFAEPLPPYEGTRARMFDAFLTLLEKLAREKPVVLMVEDVHWADQSTWDLLSYVVSNAPESPLLTIITYRNLPHGHPLRGPLAGLRQRDHVLQIELEGLPRAAVALQAAALLGRRPEEALLDNIMRRSCGNPLFVEALLQCSPGELPGGQIRDLLIAPVERLPAPTQRVLRVAAVGGAEVGHNVLSAVSELSEDDLEEALRPAVHQRILATDHDGYRFRHTLIVEAVYEGLLLPGERRRLHRRFAEAIERDPSLAPPVLCHAPGEVARHWAAAGEPVPALAATWQAARDGRDLLAHPERLRMLQRVLELWQLVDDPSKIIGVSRGDVLRDIVEAADDSGYIDLGMSLAADALDAARAEGDTRLEAQILERRARIRSRLGVAGVTSELEAALRLLPESPPSPLRTRLLSHLAQRLWAEGETREARDLSEQALKLAHETADAYSEANAGITLAGLVAEDDLEASRADFAAARELADRIGAPTLVITAYINETSVLEDLGHHAAAAETGRVGVRRAAEVGLARTLGVRVAACLSEALLSSGMWDEAVEVLSHALDLEPPRAYRATLLAVQGQILAARGNTESAARLLAEIRGLFDGKFETPANQFRQATFEATVLLQQGEAGSALNTVLDALEAYPAHLSPSRAWPMLAVGARALAEADVRARLLPARLHPQPRDGALKTLKGTVADTPIRSDADRAWCAAITASLAPTSDRWRAREEELGAWELAPQPYPLAWALLHSAEGLLARSSRAAAAEQLRRAADIAGSLGSQRLLGAVESLANRAQLSLAEPAGDEESETVGSKLGLTARESEVLRLVTLGRTNRQIANELFISTKTASVHVSRILTKMDAANRGEAAAMAHRLRIFEESA